MPSHSINSPRPRWHWVVWTSVSLMLLIVVGWVTLALVTARARRDVEERLAELRARGEPTAMSEIAFEDRKAAPDWVEKREAFRQLLEEAWQLPFDFGQDENDLDGLGGWEFADRARAAVEEYAACLRASGPLELDETSSVQDWILQRCMDPGEVERLTDCDRAGLRALYALNEPLVPAARAVLAGTWDGGREDVLRWKGLDDDIPGMRSQVTVLWTIQVLGATIPALIDEGRIDEAMSRIRDMARGLDEMRDPPFLVTTMGWQLSMSLFLTSCRHVLASHATDADWSQVLKVTSAWKPVDALDRGLRGDRALALTLFHELRDDTLNDFRPTGRFDWERPLLDLWLARDERHLLDRFSDVIQRTRGKTTAIECPLRSVRTDPASVPHMAIVSVMILPDFEQCWRLALESETKLRLVRVAIEAARSGADQGRRAASAEVDPLAGGPLQSRLDGQVLTLWSLGWNAVDDGADDRWTTQLVAGDELRCQSDVVARVRVR